MQRSRAYLNDSWDVTHTGDNCWIQVSAISPESVKAQNDAESWEKLVKVQNNDIGFVRYRNRDLVHYQSVQLKCNWNNVKPSSQSSS